jgi:hypothetical protein
VPTWLGGQSGLLLLSSDSRQRMEFDQWIDQRSEFPRVVAVHLAPPPLHFGGVDPDLRGLVALRRCEAEEPLRLARIPRYAVAVVVHRAQVRLNSAQRTAHSAQRTAQRHSASRGEDEPVGCERASERK